MWAEILGALGGGGLTGIFGSVFSNFSDYFKQKASFKHDLKMAELRSAERKMEMDMQLTMVQTEADAARDVAATEAKGKADVADAELMAESYNHDAAKYATGKKARDSVWFIIVDFIRGIIRPALTTYLAGVVTYMLIELLNILNAYCGLKTAEEVCVAVLTQEQAYVLTEHIILTILYVFTTCVFWWFGTRSKVKPPVYNG